MSHTVLGIRHHGPGSALSVLRALESMQPDCVLVEGPPDANGVLELLADPELKPPVALMVYTKKNAANAVFYPFCEWSPEFVAIRWALQRGVPVSLMDLPLAFKLREENEIRREVAPLDVLGMLAQAAGYCDGGAWWEDQVELRVDDRELFAAILLAMSAAREGEPLDPYEARREASMRKILRAANKKHDNVAVICGAFHAPALANLKAHPVGQDNALLRGLRREAVVCTWVPWANTRLSLESGYGAGMPAPGWYQAIWSAGKRDMSAALGEQALGLEAAGPQDAVQSAGSQDATSQAAGQQATPDRSGLWITPQTTGEPGMAQLPGSEGLPQSAGSGPTPAPAGSVPAPVGSQAATPQPLSPQPLPSQPTQSLPTLWLARTAQLLRARGMDISAAHVIEAVRLSVALASLRGRSRVGLAELQEATRTVLLGGADAAVSLIQRQLEVGDALGQVPEHTPTLPLQQDIETLSRKALLKRSTTPQVKVLDLRKPKSKLASVLLHRLGILGIGWGELQEVGGTGSFKEAWQLEWDPEFSLTIVSSSALGNTLEEAAAAKLALAAQSLEHLGALAQLLDRAVLARLPADALLQTLDERAAVAADILALMQALPPLVRLVRYGTVRDAPTQQILPVLERLFERVVVGLPPACAMVEQELAQSLVHGLDRCHGAVSLLRRADLSRDWGELLLKLQNSDVVHPLVRGRAARKRLEAGTLEPAALGELARQALNTVVEPLQAAQWLEGLLRGSGLVLLEQPSLWEVLDAWLGGLVESEFVSLLPLLRRSFSGFTPAERRAMGERLRRTRGPRAPQRTLELDAQRAALVLPVLQLLVGENV